MGGVFALIVVPVEENIINVAGIRTRYLEAGSGEPLVFFHGGNMGAANFAECAEAFNAVIVRFVTGISS